MKQNYVVNRFNRMTKCKEPLQTYNSLDEFIDSFPFAERQCKVQIEWSLSKHNQFVFSDMDCPYDYLLERITVD
ncbi:MAG: hypothetical protein COA32_17075 [Fluviicola sp.]|nr:MAG: hypothetical protein COA32_17075 [Fluviicola sp.]